MSLEELAEIRWKEMTYSQHKGEDDSAWLAKREEFYGSVVGNGKCIVRQMIENEEWTEVFVDKEGSRVRLTMERSTESSGVLRELLLAASQLQKSLEQFGESSTHGSSMVVVFDEVSSLLEPNASRYMAFNRVISCLKEFSIWFFMISTNSKLDLIHPPDNVYRDGKFEADPSLREVYSDDGEQRSLGKFKADPSLREVYGDDGEERSLKRFPPFVAFQLDVENRRRMLDPKKRSRELQKSLEDFSKLKYMAIFGRPLWYLYSNPLDMLQEARRKLIGGLHGSAKYDAEN
jgi:hypothetical protein